MCYKYIVPDIVKKKALSLGDVGEKWLNNIGNLITLLEDKWNVKVIKSLKGGSEAFVAEVTTTGNNKAIMKVVMPSVQGNSDFEQQITALKLANGKGYVRLIDFDLKNRALLVEKLGKPLSEFNYSSKIQMEIICKTLNQTWIVVEQEKTNLQTSTSLITWFSTFIVDLWLELKKPCEKSIVDKSLSYLENRLRVAELQNGVLVHGDAHNGNILQVETSSESESMFKFIDPDGLIAEPAYDLGVLMREWADELILNPVESGYKRSIFLGELTNVEPMSIREWGYIQAVATGLLLMKIGEKPQGMQLLDIASEWSYGFQSEPY